MHIYLPIAEMSVNIFLILAMGGGIGFLSGLFGVGGGFLMTPLLIFIGVPAPVAVGTEANQIVASSVSGVLAHWRRGNVDFKMGSILLVGGFFGSSAGVVLFKYLQFIGQIDLVIKLSFIIFLGVIGSLMFWESIRTIIRSHNPASRRRKLHQHNWLHGLPLKVRFRKSKLYISAILPLAIGAIVGVLSAIMGVGGGFIMVPAMIYLLGMNTISAIGTSLFQIVFITLNVSILQATYNQSVDLILAIFLLIGGVIGAQFGSNLTSRFRGEQIRVLLAIIVMIVCFCMGLELISEPSMNSRIIIRGTN